MAHKLFWLAIAGAFGTLARYGLSGAMQRWLGSAFPWGTDVVNILGCLLFGFVWTITGEKILVDPETRAVLLIGFMGAFTTFSTFVFETSQLLSHSEILFGLANIAFQICIGFGMFYLGQTLGRAI